MAENSLVPTSFRESAPRYNVCIIHSGSEAELSFEQFIRSKLAGLRLSCGPMNYDNSDADFAIFNGNLKTINYSQNVVIVFSQESKKNWRFRVERLIALYLHASKSPSMKIIPVALGNTPIPTKYGFFQELVVEGSSNWSYKLLQVLTEGESPDIRNLATEEFANDGKENVKAPSDEVSNDRLDEDFDELQTEFDMKCFERLEKFLRGSDSLEEDEESNTELKELESLMTQLCKRLESASYRNKLKFSQMNSNSGLFWYIGQMGLNNVHKMLMTGCGINVQNDILSLEWKTFEENLMHSAVTLADIVNFSKFIGIKRIAIKFNKETHDAIEKHYGESWQLLVEFAERILKHRFYPQGKEMLTYHVCINGNPGTGTCYAMNQTGRKLFLDNFRGQREYYSDLDARLKTYHSWPYSSIVKPIDLAKAGFIYSGHEDTITCFSCNQSVYNTKAESQLTNIMVHVQWNDNCVFLKSLPSYKEVRRKLKSQQILDDKDFTKLSIRFSTFDKDLPKGVCLEFARAGFYQSIKEKENLGIVCYSCGIKLSYIRLAQDPWIEHIRWNRNCQHVLKKRGKGFIKGILHALRADGESLDDVFAEVVIETYIMKHKPTEDGEKEERQRNEEIMVDDIELD